MNKLTLIALLAAVAGVAIGRYASLPLAAVGLAVVLGASLLYSRFYAQPKKRQQERIAQRLLDRHLVDRESIQRMREASL
jgi:Na+-driven multidrug efflux pump